MERESENPLNPVVRDNSQHHQSHSGVTRSFTHNSAPSTTPSTLVIDSLNTIGRISNISGGRSHSTASKQSSSSAHSAGGSTTGSQRSSTYGRFSRAPVVNLDFSISWLWYAEPLAEREFVAFEFHRCKYRFLVYSCIAGVLSALAMAVFSPDTTYSTVVGAGVALQLLGFVLEASIQCAFRKRFTSVEDTLSEENSNATLSIPTSPIMVSPNPEHDTSSREMQNSVRSSSGQFTGVNSEIASTVDDPPNRIDTPKVEPRTSDLEVRIARIHEVLTFFVALGAAVQSTMTYKMKQDKCDYVYHHDPDISNNEQCPDRVYMHILVNTAFPLIIGQPRLFLVVLIYAIVFLMEVAVISFHHTTTVSLLIIYALNFVALAFFGIVKYYSEKSNRQHFRTAWTLVSLIQEIAAEDDILKQFVLDTTPKYLHYRLNAPEDSMTKVDLSEKGICMLVEVRNLSRFMTSMLPVTAAHEVSCFYHQISSSAPMYGYHLLRTLGDTSYLVSNLFQVDVESTESAILNGVRFSRNRVATTSSGFEIAVGIACGKLSGMLLGKYYVRYDIFGPALLTARDLVTVGENGETVLCSVAASIAQSSLVYKNQDVKDAPSGSRLQGCKIASSIAQEQMTPGSFSSVESRPQPDPDNHNACVSKLHAAVIQSLFVVNTGQKPLAEPSLELLDAYCCAKLADNVAEDDATAYYRNKFMPTFTSINAFFVLFLVLVLLGGLQERLTTFEAEMTMFVVMTLLAVVGHVVLVFFTYTRLEADDEDHEKDEPPDRVHHNESPSSHFILYGFSTVVAFIGVNFSRPSLVGDNAGYLYFLQLLSSIFTGAPLRFTIPHQVVLTVLYYVMMVAFRPIIEQVHLVTIILLVMFIPVGVLTRSAERQLYVQMTQHVHIVKRLERHRKIRDRLFMTQVPRSVRRRVNETTSRHIDCWGCNDCLVMTFVLPAPQASLNPVHIRQHTEKTIGRIEEVVSRCRALDIVRAFGGTVIAAGPLNPGTRNTIVHAVSDMGDVLATLLKGDLQFTVGIASDLVVNVLRLSEFPSHDLMGPAVNVSQALALAAPVEMAVATRNIVQLYQRECAQASHGFKFSNSEGWRIRDLGNMRVMRIQRDPSQFIQEDEQQQQEQ